jgi:Chain length determinant protein
VPGGGGPLNLKDLFAAVRRHWVVTIACLLATGVASTMVYLNVPVYYTSQTQLVVLTPAARKDANGVDLPFNPYLTAGDGPSQVVASALERIAASPGFRAELAKRGVTTEPSAVVALGGGGVVLELATVGKDPAATGTDLDTLSVLLNETLAKQQLDAGSPENQLLTMKDLVGPSDPTPLPGDRVKLTAIAGVLGLVLTGLVITALASRSRRVPAAAQAPVMAAGGPPDTAGPAAQPAQAVPARPSQEQYRMPTLTGGQRRARQADDTVTQPVPSDGAASLRTNLPRRPVTAPQWQWPEHHHVSDTGR